LKRIALKIVIQPVTTVITKIVFFRCSKLSLEQ
jgi:hypothetical protein